MKTLEHRAKKRRKNRESGKMADKKMDENRGKQNWKREGKPKTSIVLLSPAPCKSRSFRLQLTRSIRSTSPT